MKDRKPRRPGRVLITPESGAPFYATLLRADDPEVEGDALNKLNLLPDNVAELLGLDPKLNPVPATAFEKIGEKIKNVVSFNFTVYAEADAPANPIDNDIWVITEEPMSGWVFSAAEPKSPTEGTVWLEDGGNASTVIAKFEFGSITISPVAAKQYIDGAWVEKEAKSYVNSEWVDWWLVIVNDGTHYQEAVGGWTAVGKKFASSDNAAAKPTLNSDSTTLSLTISGTDYKAYRGGILTNDDIDFEKYSKITFEGTYTDSYGGNLILSVTDRNNQYLLTGANAYVSVLQTANGASAGGNFAVTLDVSNVNEKLAIVIGVGVQNINSFSATITKLIIE